MQTSENINELATALKAFQTDFPKLSRSREVKVKTKSGGTYSFAYTPLEQILEEVLPRLGEYGLSLSQFPSANASVTNLLMHDSGQWIQETASFDISTNNPQDLGGVITYLRRYSIAGILGIVTDLDDDANKASGNTITKQKNKKQNPRKKKPSKTISETIGETTIDEFEKELQTKETVNDIVAFFNDEVSNKKGKAKDEFRKKYGPVVNDRVREIAKNRKQ